MYSLICFIETANQETVKLSEGPNGIGRDRLNQVVVPHMSLSRQHARITVGAEGAFIEDLQSRNGTYVNDSRIYTTVKLLHDDIVRCGDVLFRLQCLALPEIPIGSNVTIVKQLAPETTQVAMEDLLDNCPPKVTGSALRLSQEDLGERAIAKLNILLDVGKQLSSPEELDTLLAKILDLLFKIMNVDRAAILLVNESTGQLEQKALRSWMPQRSDSAFYSKQITNYVRVEGKAILTADAFADDRFDASESIYGQSIRASMCAPLKPKQATIGVLYVDNLSTSNAYSEEDLNFLTALANQAAIAIDNAKLYKTIEAEAVMRSRFERFFPQSVSRKLKEEGALEIIDTDVTALFADISNFTEMTSTMEPRQTIAMLNDYFQVMVEDIVFKYEGTLEKYIGDALLAVWGAPYQAPDDTERALRAAVAMQHAVQCLNSRWAEQQRDLHIQIHVGLNSGRVAAGNIGSSNLIQYATIGDTTNTTSRICNVAQAGEIVISQNTYERARGLSDLHFEPLPPTFVKGKAEPLQLYRLVWRET